MIGFRRSTKGKWKSVTAYLLTVLMTLPLVACGGEENSPAYTVGGSVPGGKGSVESSTEGSTGENSDTKASEDTAAQTGGSAGKDAGSAASSAGKDTDGAGSSTAALGAGEEYDPNELVWIMENVDVPLTDFDYYFTRLYGSDIYYPGESETAPNDICKFSVESGELSAVTMTLSPEYAEKAPLGSRVSSVAVGEDGSYYALVALRMNPEQAWDTTYHICKFDSEGKMVYATNVDNLPEETEINWGSRWQLQADGEGRVYLYCPHSVFLYNADGSLHGSIEVLDEDDREMQDIRNVVRGDDGKCYIYYSHSWGGYGTLASIDFENKNLADKEKISEGHVMALGTDKGFWVCNYDTVYKYSENLGSGNQTENALFNWLDFSIWGQSVRNIEALDSERLMVLIKSPKTDQCSTVIFERMTRAEADARNGDKKVITVGIFGNPGEQFNEAVVQFNLNSDEYVIVAENYVDASLADAERVGMDRLNSELAAGKGPDIIDIQYLDVESLASKGAFENLKDYLSKSNELSVTDFMENLVETYTVGDVLVAIPREFQVETLASYAALVGEEPGWTLAELMTLAKENRGVDLFDRLTKSQVLNALMIFNEEQFIDWEAGTCSFVSQDFKDLLQLVKEADDKLTVSEIQTSIFAKVQNEQVILAQLRVNGFNDLQPYNVAFGGNMTCIGYPAYEGNGCLGKAINTYAISSQSDNKAGAWAFLEYYLQIEEYSNTFASLKRNLENQAQEYRNKSDNTHISYPDGWQYDFHAATQEEIDQVYEILEAARFDTTSTDVLNIITEEAESFFLGQKPVDVVAEIIQNRVRNYMEENR